MSTKIEDLGDEEYDNEEEYLLDEEYEQEINIKPIVEAYNSDMSDTLIKLLDLIYQKVKHPLIVFFVCMFFINPNIVKVFEPLGHNPHLVSLYISILITLFFSILREFI